MRTITLCASALLTTLTVAGCAGAPAAEDSADTADGRSITLTSCGEKSTLAKPAEWAVTLNQGATEVALALGVADRLVGTAYLDDEVAPEFTDDYASVPVLSKEYPDQEQLLKAKPDLAYASYSSAFDAKAVGTRAELADLGIATYLSPFGCPEDSGTAPAEPSWEAVWSEVDAVAQAFGVPEKADALESEQSATLEEAEKQAAGEGVKLLWWDSGTKTPLVGAGDGGPQLVMDAVGATNIFESLEGGWADGSWEKVVDADPDAIVLVDASWAKVAEKRSFAKSDPVLRQLRAVRQNRFIEIKYSESTPGVRLIDGVSKLADGLADGRAKR